MALREFESLLPYNYIIMKLYDYQLRLYSDIKKAMLSGHKRIIVQSPTGSGKTVIFSYIIEQVNNKNNRSLIITDRIELLKSSGHTLYDFDVKVDYITAGALLPPKEYQNVVAMSQTLRKRINYPEWKAFLNSFDLIIIDEAHVQEFNTYFINNVFADYRFILGFTATPKRFKKQRQMSEDYTHIIKGPQVQELIRLGYLCSDKYYAPHHFDSSNIKLNSQGDYKESELYDRFNKKIIYSSIIRNWKNLANNTITLVFCVNIEHAINTCVTFNEEGIDAKFITSPLSRPIFNEDCTDAEFVKYLEKKRVYELYEKSINVYSGDRTTIINEWKSDKFKVLVNVDIFTKGFDYQRIETIVVNRATISETLWLQMIGRGSRIYPGKTHFNILDFGSNAERLGMYSQERVWDLNGNYSISEGVAPVKECGVIKGVYKPDKYTNKGCGALILASSRVCNYCGYVFEQEKVELEINLVQIDTYNPAKFNNVDFAKIERQAEETGRKFGWVINMIIAQGGREALKAFAKYKCYKNGWLWRMSQQYDKAISNYEHKTLKS